MREGAMEGGKVARPVLGLRTYQQALLSEAIKRNVIIRMDTGTGKTLVSVMLAKHVKSSSSAVTEGGETGERRHHLVVFICPTIALVDQNCKMFREQTLLRVQPLSGALGVDYWKTEQWTEILNSCDIAICTAQVWLNVLNNAYWHLERISLLIFDEAHHAAKNNAYALIMKNHYHRAREYNPAALLPRVLGMTASPDYSSRQASTSIDNLEALLDARLVEVEVEHQVTVEKHTPRPTEKLIEFVDTYSLLAKGRFQQKLAAIWPIWAVEVGRKTLDDYIVVDERLGPFAAGLYMMQVAEEHPQLGAAHQALQEAYAKETPSIDNSSPRVIALIGCLETFTDRTNFQAIIFVQRRLHAVILTKLLNMVVAMKGFCRATSMVGHASSTGPNEYSEMAIAMKVKKQAAVVKDFRDGVYNILVATQIAEEGLDFTACNLIVRFDMIQTVTGYIQSRGRARAANSEFVVLAKSGTEEAYRYAKFRADELTLNESYGNRPLDSPPEPDLDCMPSYRIKSTGAILTCGSAVPLLAEVLQLLSSDVYTGQQRPEFIIIRSGMSYQATLYTPNINAFNGSRSFVSDWLSSKKAAKRSAAYLACVALHQAGVLNDNFMPIRNRLQQSSGSQQSSRLPQSSRSPQEPKHHSLPAVITTEFRNLYGNMWLPGADVWLHYFKVSGIGPTPYGIAMICGSNCSAFGEQKLFSDGDDGRPTTQSVIFSLVKVEKLRWEPTVLSERLSLLRWFNHTFGLISVNRTCPDYPYLTMWAPVMDAMAGVDWDIVENAFKPALPKDLVPGCLITIPHSRVSHRFCELQKVRDDVNTLSPSLEIMKDGSAKKVKLAERFPEFSYFVSVIYDFPDVSKEEAEDILVVEPLLEPPRNRLLQSSSQAPTHKTANYPISMCQVTALPMGFWRTTLYLPSVECLLHDIMQASAAMDHLKVRSMNLNRLREALSAPGSLRGNNYQSLETYGDTVLKLTTTVHVYLQMENLTEGAMAICRQRIVSNNNLQIQSKNTGYASFVIVDVFQPHAWRCNDGLEYADDQLSFTRNVHRRVLSDTMEATLGTALLSGGIPTVLAVGARLGLLLGGVAPWSERPQAIKIGQEAKWLEYPNPRFLKLEESIGYTFKNPKHLVQAMTHVSYAYASTACYEREEFLGDALIDYWATTRIFEIFPGCTPRHATFLRSLLVSNPTLALIAIDKLGAHECVLHSSDTLGPAMQVAARQCQTETITYASVLEDLTWVWDPPKVLGDVVESITAAIFLDVGFRLEPLFKFLDEMYAHILPLIRNVETRDPQTELEIFMRARGCDKCVVTVTLGRSGEMTEAVCVFHDKPLITRNSLSASVAPQVAARDALVFFKSAEGEMSLSVCKCAEEKAQIKLEKRLAAALAAADAAAMVDQEVPTTIAESNGEQDLMSSIDVETEIIEHTAPNDPSREGSASTDSSVIIMDDLIKPYSMNDSPSEMDDSDASINNKDKKVDTGMKREVIKFDLLLLESPSKHVQQEISFQD